MVWLLQQQRCNEWKRERERKDTGSGQIRRKILISCQTRTEPVQGSIFVPLFQLKVPAQLGGPPICPGPYADFYSEVPIWIIYNMRYKVLIWIKLFAIRACERSGAGSVTVIFPSERWAVISSGGAAEFSRLWISSAQNCAFMCVSLPSFYFFYFSFDTCIVCNDYVRQKNTFGHWTTLH